MSAGWDPDIQTDEQLDAVFGRVEAPASERAHALHPLASVMLDTVQPERVEWVWPGRIPLRKVTIFEGDPGVGKGFTIAAVIAAVTGGPPLPDSMAQPPGNVVLVSLEDGVADTLRPRIEAAGADLKRVRVVTDLPSIPADVVGLAELARADDARLIVLDPITAYLGADTDSYKDQDVRRALMPLAQLAEETGCAVIVVRHLPKSRSRNAVLAGGGSIGFIGLARSALFIAAKPDAPDRRVLAVAKASLAECAPSLEFQIVTTPAGPRLEWLGRSELSAGALHAAHADAATEDVSASDEAAAWLRDLLTGRDMPRRDVLKAARAEGFSDRTTHRAAKKIGVEMVRRGFAGGSVWSLTPESADVGSSFVPTPLHSCPSKTTAPMGTNGTNGTNAPADATPAPSNPAPAYGCPTCDRRFHLDPSEPGDARCFLCRRAEARPTDATAVSAVA